MAVTLTSGTAVTAGLTTLTITGFASGITATDVLVAVLHHKGAGTPGGFTGWTLLGSQASTSGSLWVYWKVSGGTSQADVSATGLTSAALGSMAAFSGVDNTTPFVASSAPADFKSQANAEGTYQITATSGATWSMIAGAMGVAVMGIDNDATFTGFWTFLNSAGVGADDGTGIQQGNTLNGTDATLGWGRSVTTHGGETWGGFSQTITEGSAGTASNAAIMFVLNPAGAASADPGFVHRRGPNYRR